MTLAYCVCGDAYDPEHFTHHCEENDRSQDKAFRTLWLADDAGATLFVHENDHGCVEVEITDKEDWDDSSSIVIPVDDLLAGIHHITRPRND